MQTYDIRNSCEQKIPCELGLSPSSTMPTIDWTAFTPTPVGKFLAVVITALVFLGSFTAWIYAQDYQISIVQNKIDDKIKNSTVALFKLSDFELSMLPEETSSNVSVLQELDSIIEKNEWQQAANLLEKRPLTSTQEVTQLKALIKNINEEGQQKNLIQNRNAQVEIQMRSINNSFKLVFSKLKKLLDIKQEIISKQFEELKTSKDVLNVKVYTSGILEGLPVIIGIPDGITDTRRLLEYSSSKDISERIKNKDSEIKVELDNLKNETQALTKEHDRNKKESAEYIERAENNKKKIDELKQETNKQIIMALLSLLRVKSKLFI